MGNRIKWLDSARGLAFLMIIYSHIEFTNEFLMAYFYPVYLTTFFFVSGYLFNSKRNFIETIEQRFRTIIVPFLIYGILNISLSQIITFSQHDSFANELINFLTQIRGNGDGLWFLACLFVSTIPFYFLVKYIPRHFLLVFSLLVFIGNSTIKLPSLPWHIQFVAPCIFYMTLGYLFKHYEANFSFLNSIHSTFILLGIYIFEVSLYFYFYGRSVRFTSTTYIIDGLALTITGLCLCVSISKQITLFNKLLIFIGSNSLLYFCLHGKVYALLQKIYHVIFSFYNLTLSTFFSFGLGITTTISTALIVIVPVIIINRFFPWSIGKEFSFTKQSEKMG